MSLLTAHSKSYHGDRDGNRERDKDGENDRNESRVRDEDEDDWSNTETLTDHTSTIWGFAFEEGGEYMCSVGEDLGLCVWHLSAEQNNQQQSAGGRGAGP